jgi:hypothetical protein
VTPEDTLSLTVEATQRSLQDRLAECLAPAGLRARSRDTYAHTDAFLAATSRHVAAVEAVLLPSMRRRVPDGVVAVQEYLRVARRLEQTLAMVKARLYGEAHAIYLAWPQLWADVQLQLADHNRLERELVAALAGSADRADLDALARRVFDAETRGPTRPHPHLPHTGRLSPAARRLWAVADRVWDNAEGRVVPAPVRPQAHRHDSLLAQYFVADPHFDDHASMREHRPRSTRDTPGDL